MSKYVVVTWPDSQNLMDREGFRENSYLVNDDKGIEEFGSSAYFVDEDWLNGLSETPTDAEEVCRKVKDACYDAYDKLDLHHEKKFTEEVQLPEGRKAIGFYVDDDNDGVPIIEVLIDDGEDVYYEDIYDLPTEYIGKIADIVLSGDYE